VLIVVLPFLYKRFFKYFVALLSAIGIGVLLFALILAFVADRGFLGFTIGWGWLWGNLVFALLKALFNGSDSKRIFFYSDNVFPVFEYKPGNRWVFAFAFCLLASRSLFVSYLFRFSKHIFFHSDNVAHFQIQSRQQVGVCCCFIALFYTPY
jgi:hypothetical protein